MNGSPTATGTTPAPTPEPPRPMIVHSEILGPVTVSDESLIHFPAGLFGFPACREFALIPAHRTGMFWLQSVEHAELAFVLVDPFEAFPGYSAEIGAADLVDLKADDPSQVAVLAIVTLPDSREGQPTANLQGPLALCLASRTGKQLALEDPTHGVRSPFSLEP